MNPYPGQNRKFFLAAIVMAATAAKLPVQAAPEWLMLETPRFTIISQQKEKTTQEFAEEFNQFIAALRGVITADESRLPPLTIVLFNRGKDYQSYQPLRQDGKQAHWAAGMYNRTETWGVIGLSSSDKRRTVFHEGAHWYMSGLSYSYPLWLEEGLAAVFSTFKTKKDRAYWGDEIEESKEIIQRVGTFEISNLLSIIPQDQVFTDKTKVEVFYAQAWALVHYLMFGKKEGTRSALTEYMNAWQNDLPSEEALQRALGQNYAVIREALLDHVKHRSYREFSQPVNSQKIEAKVTPASPAAVELALAKLAIGANQMVQAKVHAEALVHMDPAASAGYDVLTWIAARQGENERVKAMSQQAIERGSRDPLTLVSLASALLDAAAQQTDLPEEEAARISGLCQRALASCPQLRNGYLTLAGVLLCTARPSAKEEELIRTGYRIFRNEGALPLCLASFEHQRGNTEAARRLLAEALEKRASLTRHGIFYAQQLEEDWDFEGTTKTINALLAQNKTAEAVNFLDQLMAGPLTNQRRIEVYKFKQKLREAMFDEALQEAGLLMDERKPTEALAVLDRLIAGPLTDPQRAEATARRLGVSTYIRLREAVKIAKAGQFAEARTAIRELAKQPGLDPEQRKNLTRAMMRIDNLERVLPEYREAWLRDNAGPED